ncbi:hypothetical protein LMG29739_06203 [Paraburkholderia solisilvae]|uniref:Uncharacterized protein n=1 Tax=Paraburkholderia solisilvae TaxID=624376 RepID=A0A6J5EZZ1_9BURK|nr:hypothetical protein LMG29739_06203 [Paraburkholderia solisilvae]
MPLGLQGLRHLTQHPGLTYASVAVKLDITSNIEGFVHRCHTFMARKYDLAYTVVDVSERLAGMFNESRPGAYVPPVCGEAQSARMQGLQKRRAISVPSVLGYIDRQLDKIPPKRIHSRGIVGMQRPECSLPNKILRYGARCCEVKR